MCVLSTLCGNVDKHSPFDIYIYIYTHIHICMYTQSIALTDEIWSVFCKEFGKIDRVMTASHCIYIYMLMQAYIYIYMLALASHAQLVWSSLVHVLRDSHT